MAIEELDPHTGYMTTGHEWDGIKELNSPVPRIVYFWLIATFLMALTMWAAYPAWPFGSGFTTGLLLVDERKAVSLEVQEAAAAKAAWAARLLTDQWDVVRAEPATMKQVRESGRRLFGENCAACHGQDARGQKGFPDLTTPSWIWGGYANTIAETIRVGVNSTHRESRSSQMPAFGRDQILSRVEIESVVAYVQTLSGSSSANDAETKLAAAGQAIFSANCVACHGEAGRGTPEIGAPDLTGRTWIYGGTSADIADTVWAGRQGHMPTWESRLDAIDRKILAFYLLDLREPK